MIQIGTKFVLTAKYLRGGWRSLEFKPTKNEWTMEEYSTLVENTDNWSGRILMGFKNFAVSVHPCILLSCERIQVDTLPQIIN